jgi:hypothetical protein
MALTADERVAAMRAGELSHRELAHRPRHDHTSSRG